MEGKEVKPLRDVLGPRLGLIVRVYYGPDADSPPHDNTAATVDEYTHGLSSGKYDRKGRPILTPCLPVDPFVVVDYYLPVSAVRFSSEPQEIHRVRRELPAFPPSTAKPKPPSRIKARVARMYEEGQSISQICEGLGIGRTTVYRYLDSMDVPRTWSWRDTNKSRVQNFRSGR